MKSLIVKQKSVMVDRKVENTRKLTAQLAQQQELVLLASSKEKDLKQRELTLMERECIVETTDEALRRSQMEAESLRRELEKTTRSLVEAKESLFAETSNAFDPNGIRSRRAESRAASCAESTIESTLYPSFLSSFQANSATSKSDALSVSFGDVEEEDDDETHTTTTNSIMKTPKHAVKRAETKKKKKKKKNYTSGKKRT